ncbi:MAG TPA: OmpA family protein [Stellaceae bacterium]|nr:OmpA family protein [Stellaceae bacterium]
MRRYPLALLVSLSLLAGISATASAEVKQLGGNATSQDIIKGLSPAPGAPALKFRGLRVLNSDPAAATEAPAPAVAVDIKFALNSAELSDDAKNIIKQIAIAIQSQQLASYHFLLEGHTDTTGQPGHNLALSKRRAEAVRDYLVRNYSIDASRLDAIGRGQEMLLDPANPTSPANRRVQIVNLGQ